MIRVDADDHYEYFLLYFRRTYVIVFRDRATNEIMFEMDSLAACLGFKSVEEMMVDDAVLDLVSDYIKRTGESPFQPLKPIS